MASLDSTLEPEGFDLKAEAPRDPISTLASTCASNFSNTLQLLSEDKDEKCQSLFQKFEKRFLDWAAYLGVFAGGNGSLDRRLKHHPQYRDLVLMVLDMLNVNLVQTTTEPSEPSSDESSDDEPDRRRIEAESIQNSINELDRLAIHIRQSSTSSLDVRIKAFGARKPLEVSSYEARATLAVNGLYPEASDSLRRHLSKSMAQRYTRLLYWQSHDKKLRADRRRDKQQRDDPIEPLREPPPLPTKASSLPRQPAREEEPALPKPGASKVSIGTSFLSGTWASELGSRFTIPPAEAKMPARERAGASTVLETGAKFPRPPKFEDGEDRKPCPFCRKIFLKDDFTDNKWWRAHVNDDLIPFVCVSSTCMGYPTFPGRTAWKGHIGQYHDGMWLQRLKVDSQKSSDAIRAMDICPLCCLPLAELTKLKASIPQASEPETSPLKARTPGNKKGSKTVRFDVSEPETPGTADTEGPTRTESAMILDHIADHLQFLALLTTRLSTEKLSEEGTHTFSSDQGFSSDQDSGKRSTLDDDFEFAEGDEIQGADMDAPFDEAPQTEATTDQAWQEDEDFESGEAMDWNFIATLTPSNKGDDKIEHMQRVRAECVKLLEAALESSVEGRHDKRLFLETAAASCKSITTEMLAALETEVAVGALIAAFAREIPRDALHGFFRKTLTLVDSGKDSMLVDYCTEQVWDFRLYQDSHVSAEERFASRRVLFGLLAMLDQPLDILRAIKDGISDLSIPLATVTLTKLFPTWTETMVSSFMRFQRHVPARVFDGHDFRHFTDSSQPDQKHQDYMEEQQWLKDLFEIDPRDAKKRIEAINGGLFRDSYRWILDHDDFQRWRSDPQIQLLWIEGDPGKGKTMLLCGIIDELEKELPLLSYFFCQATDRYLRDSTAVLRGLIYLLAAQQPSLISYIREKYGPIGKRLVEDENTWEALSKILAAMLDDPSLKGAVLIIDALNECEINQHLLLDLIAKPSPIKWIISTRSFPGIKGKLNNIKQKVRLDLNLNTGLIQSAVDLYVRHKVVMLARQKNYNRQLQDTVEKHLLNKANGTFLWVALVFQELAIMRLGDVQVLEVMNRRPPGLEALYEGMVQRIENLSRRDRLSCQDILSTVAVAYRPLCLEELGPLSGFPSDIQESADEVSEIISKCESFLTIRDNIVDTIHQSAKDFLVSSPFLFPSGTAHQHHYIFSWSLTTLSAFLRRDPWVLSTPGCSIDQASPPDPDPLSSIRYSCVYWVDHLVNSNLTSDSEDLQDYGTVHQFIQTAYLYWLESLSLLRSMSEGVQAMHKLEALVRDTGSQLVAALIRDACQFILMHKQAIEIAPLQTYASALLFSPERSLIRKLFKREEPNWMTLKPRMESDWNTCQQTLKEHSGSVSPVALSADGRRVASGSDDNTIKVWDTMTGAYIHILHGHSGSVSSIAFSTDSQLLASGSDDNTIKVWDTVIGVCVQTLEVGRAMIHLSFDPTSASRLVTDIGLLNLDLLDLPPAIEGQSTEAVSRGVSRSGYGVSTGGVWIVKDEKGLLWLPPEYRAVTSAVVGPTVAIGTRSGRVLVMKFLETDTSDDSDSSS